MVGKEGFYPVDAGQDPDAFTVFAGSNGSIGSFDYTPIDMTNGSTVRASPGALTPAGSAFTDTWRSS